MLKNKRFGRFQIEVELMNDNPEVAKAITGMCLILRAEYMLSSNAVEFVAACDEFEEHNALTEVPFYDIEIEQAGEDYSVTFKKQG